MPLLDSCHVLTGSTRLLVHVLASSPEIGTKFPEVFSLTIFRRWAAEFSLQRRLLRMGN